MSAATGETKTWLDHGPVTDRAVLLLLTLGGCILPWAVIFIALPPHAQDFPLSDDWAFARGAMALARGEGVHYYGWSSIPLWGQWAWACPFLWLFGYSHTVLRLSTICLSWVGVVAFYDILRREAAFSPRRAGFAAAALAFNPMYFWMAGSFMSDVPALALALAALALYGRAARGAGVGWLAAAVVAATLAATTRQNALAAPLAAAVYAVRQPALRIRPSWWLAVLVPAGAGLAAGWWLSRRPDIIPRQPLTPGPTDLALCALFMFHTLGLATVPALVATRSTGGRAWFGVGLAFLTGSAVYAWAGPALCFPYLMRMQPGFSYFLGCPDVAGSGELYSLVGTVAGCVAGAELFARATGRAARRLPVPLLAFTVLHLAVLSLAPFWVYRYLLVAVPGALAVALAGAPAAPLRRRVGIALVAASGVFAVLAMHDWLAWNAARWRLGDRALARGIPARALEGGFEWDGWHADQPATYDPADPFGLRLRTPGLMMSANHAVFRHLTGEYALSLAPIPGKEIIDEEPFTFWLEPGPHACYLLRDRR